MLNKNLNNIINYTEEDLKIIQKNKDNITKICNSYIPTHNYINIHEYKNKYQMKISLHAARPPNILDIIDIFDTSLEAAIHSDIQTLYNQRVLIPGMFPKCAKRVRTATLFNYATCSFDAYNSCLNFSEITIHLYRSISNLYDLRDVTNIRKLIYNHYKMINYFKEKVDKLKNSPQTEKIIHKLNRNIYKMEFEENKMNYLANNSVVLKELKEYLKHVINRVRSNEKTTNEKFLILDSIIFEDKQFVNKFKTILMKEKEKFFERKRNAGEVEKLKEIYSKKKCFILGNGPSLKEIDLSLLKNEVVIGSNYLINGLSESNCNFIPTIISSGDQTCTMKIIDDNNIDLINKNTTVMLHPTHKDQLIQNEVVHNGIYSKLKNKEINYFLIKRFDEFLLDKKFNTRPEFMYNRINYCAIYRNIVSMINMLIAEKLGFKEIYLLGCDMNNFTNHFYDYKSHTRLDRGPGDIYGDEGYRLVYKGFDTRKKDFDKQNIKVYNCTLKSSLTMFEKVNFHDVIHSVEEQEHKVEEQEHKVEEQEHKVEEQEKEGIN